MVKKLEVIGNTVIICVGLLIGYTVIKDRYLSSDSRHNSSVRVPDHLPKTGLVEWAQREPTLVLFLKKGCHFCEESMPFYRKLNQLHDSNQFKAALISIFPDEAKATSEYLKANGLSVQGVPNISLPTLGIPGTPALLLVDRNGKVLKSWLGRLSNAQETDVIKTLKSP